MWPVRCSSIVRDGSRPSGIGKKAPQASVGQDVAPVVAQADAGIGEPRGRRHRLHVDQRVAALARRMVLLAVAFGWTTRRGQRVSDMVSVAHRGMAHVGHGQQRPRIRVRDRRRQAVARGQRPAGVPAAIQRLREDRERLLPDGSTMASTVSAVPIRSSSIVIGWTYWPSAATTVIFRPGMRTSK